MTDALRARRRVGRKRKRGGRGRRAGGVRARPAAGAGRFAYRVRHGGCGKADGGNGVNRGQGDGEDGEKRRGRNKAPERREQAGGKTHRKGGPGAGTGDTSLPRGHAWERRRLPRGTSAGAQGNVLLSGGYAAGGAERGTGEGRGRARPQESDVSHTVFDTAGVEKQTAGTA